MLKGIWSFSFKGSNIAFNTGAMFFVGDRFYGGSSHYYTIGKFEQEGLDIAAKVEIKSHFEKRESQSLIPNLFTLSGSTNKAESLLQLVGVAAENPNILLTIAMLKMEEYEH